MPSLEERVETLEHLLKKYVLMQNVSPGQHFLTDEDVLTQVSAASRQLWILNLTLSSNTPGAGSITWSDFDLYWLGVHYSIPGGNTANKYVWWNAGDANLTTGDVFTPALDRFLIFTNTTGTADEAWNKVGKGSVQRDNMGFVLDGGIYQPAALASANIDVYSTGYTQVLDVSGAGALLSLGFRVTLGVGAGNWTCTFEWQIDDAGYQVIPLYTNSYLNFDYDAVAVCSKVNSGGTEGIYITFQLGLPYETSLKVRVNVTGTMGGSGTTARAMALRASKL